MRVLSQTELSRMNCAELAILLRTITCELPRLREGSRRGTSFRPGQMPPRHKGRRTSVAHAAAGRPGAGCAGRLARDDWIITSSDRFSAVI